MILTEDEVRGAVDWLFPALRIADTPVRVRTDLPAGGIWVTMERKDAPSAIFIGDEAMHKFLSRDVKRTEFDSPICPSATEAGTPIDR